MSIQVVEILLSCADSDETEQVDKNNLYLDCSEMPTGTFFYALTHFVMMTRNDYPVTMIPHSSDTLLKTTV